MRVGLLDEQGHAIAGRRPQDCRPHDRRSLRKTVEWEENADVSPWSRQPVRLLVDCRDADVFGFQFVPEVQD